MSGYFVAMGREEYATQLQIWILLVKKLGQNVCCFLDAIEKFYRHFNAFRDYSSRSSIFLQVVCHLCHSDNLNRSETRTFRSIDLESSAQLQRLYNCTKIKETVFVFFANRSDKQLKTDTIALECLILRSTFQWWKRKQNLETNIRIFFIYISSNKT